LKIHSGAIACSCDFPFLEAVEKAVTELVRIHDHVNEVNKKQLPLSDSACPYLSIASLPSAAFFFDDLFMMACYEAKQSGFLRCIGIAREQDLVEPSHHCPFLSSPQGLRPTKHYFTVEQGEGVDRYRGGAQNICSLRAFRRPELLRISDRREGKSASVRNRTLAT
jgi:hypothetical protein